MTRVRTVVATELLLVFGLVAFVGVAYAIERIGGLTEPVALGSVPALLLSSAPALLWLSYFHHQDRYEPEPKHYVFGVYLVGAFVAAPVADFVISTVTPTEAFAAPDGALLSMRSLIAAIGITGLCQELCKFAAVRYTVYMSEEFDEPMDGIIYMTAAGVGFATYENFNYLSGLGGTVYLASGAANVVVTTLAHACFAGGVGYLLGVTRFGNHRASSRIVILIGGLIVVAILNGAFQLVEAGVRNTSLGIAAWRGVAFAAMFSMVIFAIVSVLMRRHLAASPHRPAGHDS